MVEVRRYAPLKGHQGDYAHTGTLRYPMAGSVRLWHDDVRSPPDRSWVWARTNEVARNVLDQGRVVEISMDHDLGGHWGEPDSVEVMCIMGDNCPEGSGFDLAHWMVEHNLLPALITVHSWNGGAGFRMVKYFRNNGHPTARQIPYDSERLDHYRVA